LSAPVAPVSTPVVVQSSVKSSLTTPTSAQAAIIAPVTIPGVDDQGQIKAAEDTSSTSSNKINWTPWIILFILILLAGAATGGYFYWFGGDSEASAATVATGEKTTAAAPLKKDAPKATSAKGGKKPRRW
jgi:hypothetical protein